MVIAVRTADPLNLHESHYGTDHNGRVDSIWTVFSADSGFGGGTHAVSNPKYPKQGKARGDTAEVVYRYTKLGVVDSMLMPRIAVAVNYDYNHRQWLDSITAMKGDSLRFRQVLTYDSSGQITSQWFRHDSLPENLHNYYYDNIDRLTGWWIDDAPDTTKYSYDAVGTGRGTRCRGARASTRAAMPGEWDRT